MADYLGADCFAVGVLPRRGDHRQQTNASMRSRRILTLPGIFTLKRVSWKGMIPAETIVDFARRNRITQILLGRPKHHSWGRPARHRSDSANRSQGEGYSRYYPR